MASAWNCTIGFFVLILSWRVISSAAADQYYGSSCSGMSSNLGEGCSISDDCSTITCNMDFVKKPITFKLKVNKCDEPVSVTASMNVQDLGITWSHTYTSDDIIEVPGFTVSLPSIFSAGVYVQVGLTDNGDNLHLKVNLLAGGSIFGKSTYPVKATVAKGDLPISTNDCGVFGWWNDLGDLTKAAVIGGPIVLIILITICCCCYCGCCKSSPANAGAVIVAPAAPVVATTGFNSTVPMRPLVNVT